MGVRNGEGRQGIQSIEVGARLLEALAAEPRPMMLRDLAAAAGMPPAKAHRYLVSFARMGLVEQEPGSGRYGLGPFALQLGLAGLARLDPYRLALPVLEELSATLDQTVAAAVWGNHGATIVRWLESSQPVTASLRTGAVMPLTRSASGRMFLAFLPPARTAKLTREELLLNARAGLSPASGDELARIVEQTRRHGLARATGDMVPGVSGLAAPVFDCNGALVLGLVALGYAGTFDATWDGPNAAALREGATRLSARLGYAGGTSVEARR
jgi:DNA-binding IclR family transcriptional regulator